MSKQRKNVSLTWLVVVALVLALALPGMAMAATEDTATYNFENGDLQGWTGAEAQPQYGDGTSTVAVDSTNVYAGASALKVTSAGDGKNWYALIDATKVQAGMTLTFHVFIPADSKINGYQPFHQDKDWAWANGAWQSTKGEWVEFTYKIPDDVKMPINKVGLQFLYAEPTAESVWIDSVSDGTTAAAPAEEVTTEETTPADTADTADTAATTDSNPKTGDAGMLPFVLLAGVSGVAMLRMRKSK